MPPQSGSVKKIDLVFIRILLENKNNHLLLREIYVSLLVNWLFFSSTRKQEDKMFFFFLSFLFFKHIFKHSNAICVL